MTGPSSRVPLFWVQVDQSHVADDGVIYPDTFNVPWNMQVIVPDQLSDAVGMAAKQLHVAAHYDQKMHKAFVYKIGRHYDFDFVRRSALEIVATLTAISDHRVRVTYHNGKEPETLYL